MITLNIKGSSLEVLNDTTVLLLMPLKNIAFNSLALYGDVPMITLYNINVGQNEILFTQPLSNVANTNGYFFSVSSFIEFASSNFGVDSVVEVSNTSQAGLNGATCFAIVNTQSKSRDTNQGVIKASHGVMYSYSFVNTSADEVAYVGLFSKGSTPTEGDIPLMIISVPCNELGAGITETFPLGLNFPDGIAYYMSTDPTLFNQGKPQNETLVMNVVFDNTPALPSPPNFDVTADWNGVDVYNESDFVEWLQDGEDGDGDNNSVENVKVSGFQMSGTGENINIVANVSGTLDDDDFNMSDMNVTKFDGMGAITGCSKLKIKYGSFEKFDPKYALPSDLGGLALAEGECKYFTPTIHPLPDTIQNLGMSDNGMLVFNPINLPNSLQSLGLYNNSLTEFELPYELPPNLEDLYLGRNSIKSFPTMLTKGFPNHQSDYFSIYLDDNYITGDVTFIYPPFGGDLDLEDNLFVSTDLINLDASNVAPKEEGDSADIYIDIKRSNGYSNDEGKPISEGISFINSFLFPSVLDDNIYIYIGVDYCNIDFDLFAQTQWVQNLAEVQEAEIQFRGSIGTSVKGTELETLFEDAGWQVEGQWDFQAEANWNALFGTQFWSSPQFTSYLNNGTDGNGNQNNHGTYFQTNRLYKNDINGQDSTMVSVSWNIESEPTSGNLYFENIGLKSFQSLSEVEGIQKLFLNDNPSLTSFEPTQKINLASGGTSLNINNCGLTVFDPKVALPNVLRNLNLVNNSITNFDPSIALPNGLNKMSLQNNKIAVFNPTLALPTGLDELNLQSNLLTFFNPTLEYPYDDVLDLDLSNNLMRLEGYTQSEPWAEKLPEATNGGSIEFDGNLDSVSGTNLETILTSKGYTVVSQLGGKGKGEGEGDGLGGGKPPTDIGDGLKIEN
jgi:Leucine-rich repeat (LRR) protein